MTNGVNDSSAINHTHSVKQPLATLNFPDKRGEADHVKNVGLKLLALREMLTALAGRKGELTVSVENCPAAEVPISPIDLTKALINLIRNSSEAISAQGHIAIAATGLREESGRRSVVVSVEDDGLAIPLSQLERIFDSEAPLESQLDAYQPRMRVRSRRLGLRVVRELVEAAGGKVYAKRLPERGSRFEIILPIVCPENLGSERQEAVA